jgi:hypothetical protein
MLAARAEASFRDGALPERATNAAASEIVLGSSGEKWIFRNLRGWFLNDPQSIGKRSKS